MESKGLFMRLTCGLAVGLAASMASGQAAPIPHNEVPVRLDTGVVSAPVNAGVDVTDEIVVFVDEIRVPNASWLRLKFDQVDLAPGAYLRITSMLDGGQQILREDSLRDWNNTSAYMNGDTVHLEIVAHPGSGPSRLAMSEVTAGDPVSPESICGPTDDRIRSNDARQGRLMPIGCTAWLIENGNFGNRFLTAGHCISNGTSNAVVQFNVPLSSGSGAPVNPPPQDQYPVPSGNINSNGGLGPGDDHAHFFTGVNANTGLTPREAQGGGAYRLANTAPAVSGQFIQIVGYGTVSSPVSPTLSQVQKTHQGPFALHSGNLIRYETDTSGGNSGSPVVDSSGAGLAIGIHTHAGCTSTGGSNQGTDIAHAGIQANLAAPSGTGIAMDKGAVTTFFDSNNGGSNGGAVYFDVDVQGSAIRITGLQMNVQASFGTNFSVDVYTIEGTSVGNQTNMGLWTLRDSGSATAAERECATQVELDNGFELDANTSYGMALVLSAATGHAYTNGTGGNQNFSNADLSISLGSATNVPFSGTPFDPRVWNGTIQYELVAGTAGVGPFAYSIQSNGDDVLYRIDLTTGQATPLGTPMAFDDAEGLTAGPNGRLYAIGGTEEELWNVTSYPGELIGGTGTRDGIDAGLDFHRGTLYNMQGAAGGSSLYRVNPNNGSSALIGTSTEFGDGLAIHPRTGDAFTADFIFTDTLYSVNLSNGAFTPIGVMGGGGGQSGLAFLGDTLYALTSNGAIYTIDTSTGAATEVANVGTGGWEGLAIVCDGCDDPELRPFGRTFSSATLTRGYWFEAPRDFLICGLRVPDEAGAGVQNVEVVRVNEPVPAFPGTTNNFESLFRAVGVDGNNVIPAGVPVREGDIIAIIGATGTATMNNSYATPDGPFNIDIGGSSAEVTRAGMQFNLNSTPLQDLWTEPGGPVSRVEMYYIIPADVTLDADTAATGANLDTTPLVTSLGTITSTGPGVEIRDNAGELELIRAGSGGDVFDQINSPTSMAELSFDFDVTSITFIYGGNFGEITVTAFNSGGGIVDQFFQASTGTGEPAGPVTIAGEGIRRLHWADPSGSFAPLDNIKIIGIENVTCYPDCDGNTILDVFDFLCFQDAFVAMDPYADCDGNRVFDVFDFLCFQDAFVTGCP